MSKPTPGIPELVAVIQSLSDKVERLEKAARMPHITPATMATALFLTGITTRRKIANTLGVSTQTLRTSRVYYAFRLAEGAVRSRQSVSRRSRSGDDFTETDD